jgi:hypothetical protein
MEKKIAAAEADDILTRLGMWDGNRWPGFTASQGLKNQESKNPGK